MNELKVGDVCKIVGIHPKDGYYVHSGRLLGKRVEILWLIGMELEKEFKYCEIKALEDVVGLWVKGSKHTFFAVKFEKI